ncbi:MAG: hypothetical protein AB7S78_06960 [Candidatus Omnitrophota bacterium]
MKKIYSILFIAWVILVPNAGYSHPPSDLELSYDLEKQIFLVKMRHTTHDPREDYIRKLEISVNGQEPVVKHYTIQLNTLMFSDNVSVPAKEGDFIKVKAFSKEGGSSESTLQVPKKEDKKTTAEQPVPSNASDQKEIKKSSGSGY